MAKKKIYDSYNLSFEHGDGEYSGYSSEIRSDESKFASYTLTKANQNKNIKAYSDLKSRTKNQKNAYVGDTYRGSDTSFSAAEPEIRHSLENEYSSYLPEQQHENNKSFKDRKYNYDTKRTDAKFDKKNNESKLLSYTPEREKRKSQYKNYKLSSYSFNNNHSIKQFKDTSNDIHKSFKSLLHANCIYDRSEIEWYNKFNRFGCIDPYNRLGVTKEYLFFTKPDLHIWEPHTTTLNPQLSGDPYFIDLSNRYPYVIHMLQRSAGGGPSKLRKNPFMAILTNSVKNSLDLDDINADDIETATNMFGTKISYRKHTWAADEGIDFSLEFEDTKYLEIYNLLKAYDKYNRYAQFGIVDPPNIDKAKVSKSGYNFNSYIKNKENIETFGIYKFITGEDYETIVYWAYICGCYFKNVPRGTFGDLGNGDPLKYNVQFHGFIMDESTPEILEDFNALILDSYGNKVPGKNFPIYNNSKRRVNGEWATIPYITKVNNNTKGESFDAISGMNYIYKLKWRK